MKIKSFEENINSQVLLLITFISYLYFFIIKNQFYYLPVLVFVLIAYLYNGLRLRKFLKIFAVVTFFSFVYSSVVLIFPNEKMLYGVVYSWKGFRVSSLLLEKQLNIFYRLVTITTVSITSVYAINFEKVMIALMANKFISTRFGYPLLLAFNSVRLLKREFELIKINAQFRKIGFIQRWSFLFPILVFSIRHAERGSLSLITRGLTENKKYYFSTSHKSSDTVIAILFAFILSISLIFNYNLVSFN